ncbi:hypothetical protein M407DRAFT_24371 [Tulasnella calospora MUT 4182]|uniref:Elongation factor 1 beta central acidic region eukaryote domain-containing protein n=1 Tax=Tulasnella calospora MUT 4182 TaxID=1051891 RepID=A0A0C3QJM2_9AGAM|nr:hypothetical protein M407DRAFT_24371 [Tulasnella calospora MUT 4182]
MSLDLKALNQHLSTRSYVEGYTPSQADVGVYTSVGSAPDAGQYPHAARWYKHIASYAQEHETLPGDKEASLKLFAAGASGAAAPAAAAEEEEDIDLFGSDDEEDPEAEAEKQRRLDEYNEKKKNKVKPVAKVRLNVDPDF